MLCCAEQHQPRTPVHAFARSAWRTGGRRPVHQGKERGFQGEQTPVHEFEGRAPRETRGAKGRRGGGKRVQFSVLSLTESLHEDMERLCSRLLPTPVVMIQSEIPIKYLRPRSVAGRMLSGRRRRRLLCLSLSHTDTHTRARAHSLFLARPLSRCLSHARTPSRSHTDPLLPETASLSHRHRPHTSNMFTHQGWPASWRKRTF